MTLVMLFVFLPALTGLVGCYAGYTNFSDTVFNSEMYLSVSYYGKNAQAAYNAMTSELAQLEKLVNRHNENSAISKFNAAPKGTSIDIDKRLYEILSAAIGVSDKTDGAFDISLSPLNALWHTDSIGLAGDAPMSFPDYTEVERVRAITGLTASPAHFSLTEADGTYTLTKHTDGFELDLNGYIKGYAVGRLSDIASIKGATSALIELAGEVAAVGDSYRDNAARPWSVGIDNPDRDTEGFSSFICAFKQAGGFYLATSGSYRRYYDTDTESGTLRAHHIIDGRSGCPTGIAYEDGAYRADGSAVTSATVLALDAGVADAYATAVCVMGAVRGAEFLRDNGAKGIIFTANKEMHVVGEFEFMDGKAYDHYREYTRIDYEVAV